MFIQAQGEFHKGGITVAAGTLLNVLIPPKKKCYTVITDLEYITGTTAHTLTIMKPIGTTTLSAAAAAAQKVVALTADPGASLLGPNGTASQLAADGIAANDWVAFEAPDGTFYFDKVASVSSLNITMTSNLPTNGLAAGARVWFFGQAADKDPFTSEAFYFLSPPAAASGTSAVKYPAVASAIVAKSNRIYEPILVQSSNGTVAGTFDQVSGIYTTA